MAIMNHCDTGFLPLIGRGFILCTSDVQCPLRPCRGYWLMPFMRRRIQQVEDALTQAPRLSTPRPSEFQLSIIADPHNRIPDSLPFNTHQTLRHCFSPHAKTPQDNLKVHNLILHPSLLSYPAQHITRQLIRRIIRPAIRLFKPQIPGGQRK